MFNFINRIIESIKGFLLDHSEPDNLQELTTIEPSQQLPTEATQLEDSQPKTAEDLEVKEDRGQWGIKKPSASALEPRAFPVKEKSLQPEPVTLQQQINSLEDGATLQLWPAGGEYQGPIIINHPLSLDGQGATIWALTGPVISIESEQVKLRNLRIEVTGEEVTINPEDKCAILLKSAAKSQFNHVEVRGLVMGIPEEEGEWKYPNSLYLGQLAHGREHDLLLRIVVPVACKISANISGLEFYPRHLTPGGNEIRLHIEQLPEDTLINGSIFLVSTSVKRRISLTAHILSLSDEAVGSTGSNVVWQAEDWVKIRLGKKVGNREQERGNNRQQLTPIALGKDLGKKSIVHPPKPEPIEDQSNQSPPENQDNPVEVIPRYPESTKLPSKSRLVQSQPLNPLFENQISPQEPQEEEVAASEPNKDSQTVNPIFKPKSSPTESAHQQQKSPEQKSSEQSPTINPLFEQKSSPTESTPEQQTSPEQKSSKRAQRSQLINPLFKSNSP
ncbi:MAG: hypothetical protein F6K16_19675 [Symploca sp. SIO2B6]|nr:hypothetical protein [Symploca sp. SIO2B6]